MNIIECYDYCCGRSLYLFEKLNMFFISNVCLVLNFILSFGRIPGVCILYADISEHCLLFLLR